LTVYVDSSFLVSVYIEDVHSPAADELLSTQPTILLTSLHIAEWAHAVGQQVFRRQISASDARRVEREFETDHQAGLWRHVTIPESSFELCAQLARRHGAKLGVRMLDSLHVACALELKAEQFWTFDERQKKVAKAEGMKTN